MLRELVQRARVLWRLPKLQVLKHRRNLGYGGNQKAGYRYFMDKGFDIVVLLHGDGQYAPEILSHLYHPIVAGEAEVRDRARDERIALAPEAKAMVRGHPVEYLQAEVQEEELVQPSLARIHPGGCDCKGGAS